MKALLLIELIFVLSMGAVRSQTRAPSADAILKEACQQALAENKKVFVIFHASWCGWCRKMDTVLNEPAVKPLFDANYITRHVVIMERSDRKVLETPGGLELVKKYMSNVNGIPAWMIFDASGTFLTDSRLRTGSSTLIGENTGCPATKEEIEYFISTLKKTSSLTAEQLTQIARAFGKIRNIAF